MMESETVLQACIRYPPAIGGVENYVRDIVKELPGQEVVTSDLADHLTFRRLAEEQVARRPGNVSTLTARRLPGISGYPTLEGLHRMLRRHDGVVHAHALYYHPFDASLVLRRAFDGPLVLSPYFNVRSSPRTRPYFGLVNRLIERSDCLVFLTEYEAASMLDRVPRASAVPHRLVPPLIEGSPAADFDSDLVVTVGRLDEGKGTRDLPLIAARLAKQRPGTRLRVLGAQSDMSEWLCREAAGLGGAIDVVVNASDAEIRGSVRSAAAFLTPSRYEAFGIAAVEAAASGVPVACYGVGALPTVLQTEDRLLAPAFDPLDLAEATLVLLSRGEGRADREARAARYRAAFGLDRWRNDWREVYTGV